MKKYFLFLTVSFLAFTACKSTQSSMNKNTSTLEGTWELNYISGPRIAFDGLYPDKKPTISFDLKENKVSGNNSCNQYFGTLKVEGSKINFKDAKMGMSMMACPGNGENTYMKMLEKIDSYSISEDGKTLNFIMGDIAMMRFEKN
jgi:heat shock protein HslJ